MYENDILNLSRRRYRSKLFVSSVQVSVHFYVLKVAGATRQVCKCALHD